MSKSVISAVMLTMLAYFLFSFQDASVKWLVTTLPVVQILFMRSVVILAICLMIGRRQLVADSLGSPVLGSMFIRNLLLLAAWLAYYTAAADLGLAELTTVYYASPIIITLLAVPILKEKVPPLRWVAVVLGFIGVVVAVDPVSRGMTLSMPVGLALLAAVFWACSTVLLRKTALQESTLVQMTLSSAFFVATCGAGMLFYARPMSMTDVLLASGLGIVAGVAQYALFESFRRAPVSILAPFEYTSLIWAFLLGFIIWGDIPKHSVFIGAALIFMAGVIIVVGERFVGRVAKQLQR